MLNMDSHPNERMSLPCKSLLAAVTLVWPTAGDARALHLVCFGAGSSDRTSITTGNLYDNQGNSVTGQVFTEQAVTFRDQVILEIQDDDSGRIRMPPAMLPPIRGGTDGWFDLKKVKITDSEITGVVQVNFINSPKLRLDRVQGSISINGKAGDYSGTCQPYDPSTAVRKF